MKTRLLFLLFLSCTSLTAQEMSPYEQVSEMAVMDRHQRMRVAQAIQDFGPEANQVKDCWKRIIQMDSLHGAMLMEIHERFGFNRFISKGGQSAHSLWLLVMHQDDAIHIQVALLDVMKSQLGRGNVIIRDLAFLEDRVAVNKNEPQPYGTQTYLDKEKNKYVPFPMREEGLKQRRERMSLKPLRKQLREENKRHKVKF